MHRDLLSSKVKAIKTNPFLLLWWDIIPILHVWVCLINELSLLFLRN